MFNLEQLLHPVSAVSPCGDDITFSQELDAIARASTMTPAWIRASG